MAVRARARGSRAVGAAPRAGDRGGFIKAARASRSATDSAGSFTGSCRSSIERSLHAQHRAGSLDQEEEEGDEERARRKEKPLSRALLDMRRED